MTGASMRQVLITGGAGFIGSHTADALLAQGFSVRVLDNFSSGNHADLNTAALADGRLTVVKGDTRDAATVDAAMKGIDAVLHLAALVSVPLSVADPVASSTHNIAGFFKRARCRAQTQDSPHGLCVKCCGLRRA